MVCYRIGPLGPDRTSSGVRSDGPVQSHFKIGPQPYFLRFLILFLSPLSLTMTPETPLPSELKPSHADKNPSTNAQRCLCHGC